MITQYLLAIVAVCMISVVALALVHGQTMQRVIRFVGGLLLLLVVAKPLISLDFVALVEEFTVSEGGFDTDIARNTYEERLREHIKTTTEAYIEDKATQLGADIQVQVTVSQGELPVPEKVTIIGIMSPEQRTALEAYLTDALGITQEEWKLYE